jgi:hypothetical protein
VDEYDGTGAFDAAIEWSDALGEAMLELEQAASAIQMAARIIDEIRDDMLAMGLDMPDTGGVEDRDD